MNAVSLDLFAKNFGNIIFANTIQYGSVGWNTNISWWSFDYKQKLKNMTGNKIGTKNI